MNATRDALRRSCDGASRCIRWALLTRLGPSTYNLDDDEDEDDLGMSFSGFDDTTPGWGVPTPTTGDIVTNAIRKEKLIKYVTFW